MLCMGWRHFLLKMKASGSGRSRPVPRCDVQPTLHPATNRPLLQAQKSAPVLAGGAPGRQALRPAGLCRYIAWLVM